MPDIAQGSHVDLILAADDAYQVSAAGSASVVVVSGAPASTTPVNANTLKFGPYGANNVKLTINATSGKATYALVKKAPVFYNPDTGNLEANGVPTSTGSGASLVTTKTLAAADAGKVNEVAANATLTVTPGFAGCIVKVIGSAVCTVAFSGGATGNGSSSSVTRSGYQMFAIDPCITAAPNDFFVGGV